MENEILAPLIIACIYIGFRLSSLDRRIKKLEKKNG